MVALRDAPRSPSRGERTVALPTPGSPVAVPVAPDRHTALAPPRRCALQRATPLKSSSKSFCQNDGPMSRFLPLDEARPLHVDTRVTFPSGQSQCRARVLLILGDGLIPDTSRSDTGNVVVLTDVTPFHPLDDNWPDQPGDCGSIVSDAAAWEVVDSVVAAVNTATGELCLGSEIRAGRGEPGHLFLVAHLTSPRAVSPGKPHIETVVGTEITMAVDAQRRRNLSRAHTACHLMALALNRSMADLWAKIIDLDSLGAPNFRQSSDLDISN